jgi:hypothetical protein
MAFHLPQMVLRCQDLAFPNLLAVASHCRLPGDPTLVVAREGEELLHSRNTA